jgi:phosphomannomutase
MIVSLEDLSRESSVRFGTSGVRGLVSNMTDFVCYVYTCCYIKYLESIGDLSHASQNQIALGGDLRDSTDRIIIAVSKAVKDLGYDVIFCGKLPTPALFYFGVSNGLPSIMVTGSHIPANRNGIKYHKSSGELLKDDENIIKSSRFEVNEDIFDERGNFKNVSRLIYTTNQDASKIFINRYTKFFPENILEGMRVVVYEYSAVGRDMLSDLLRKLGAEVVCIGRSQEFIALDTEALDFEKLSFFKEKVKEYSADALVSTDGDSDRPVVCDERGEFVRGDVLGILVSKFLEADAVVTTASANSAVEESGFFSKVVRTKIGSPYVISEMLKLDGQFRTIVGYEPNGGFLLQSSISLNGLRKLDRLLSRDSFLPILSVLAYSHVSGKKISNLLDLLPSRFTFSEHIEGVSTESSSHFMDKHFNTGNIAMDIRNAEELFSGLIDQISNIEKIDGVRILSKNREVIHIRPSGNAPELRIYSESNNPNRARLICEEVKRILLKKL